MQQLIDWVLGIMESVGGPGIALAIFLENLFPPIPSEAVLGAAGVLMGTSKASSGISTVACGPRLSTITASHTRPGCAAIKRRVWWRRLRRSACRVASAFMNATGVPVLR